VLLVVCSAAACVLLGSTPSEGSQDSAGWSLFAAGTTAFAAIGFLLKETAFRRYVRLPRQAAAAGASPLDEFLLELGPQEELHFVTVGAVVSGFSLLTCVPVMVLSRVMLNADQAPLGTAVAALVEQEHALACFAVYEAINLLWNAALLGLTAKGSALHAFLALKMVVPSVALLSFIDWPLIGSRPTSPLQWLALVGLGVGVVGYQTGNRRKQAQSDEFVSDDSASSDSLEKDGSSCVPPESGTEPELEPEPEPEPEPKLGTKPRGRHLRQTFSFFSANLTVFRLPPSPIPAVRR